MHTAYTFGVQHVYYIWSLPTSEETKSVAVKGHQTNTRNTRQKRKLQIQLFFALTASSKYADDFLPSEYVLDICCDGTWTNISRSQAVGLRTSTSTITPPFLFNAYSSRVKGCKSKKLIWHWYRFQCKHSIGLASQTYFACAVYYCVHRKEGRVENIFPGAQNTSGSQDYARRRRINARNCAAFTRSRENTGDYLDSPQGIEAFGHLTPSVQSLMSSLASVSSTIGWCCVTYTKLTFPYRMVGMQ